MKFSRRERRAKGRVRLLRACGSAELREGASGFATQGLWLKNGKVGSQVSGIDQSRFPRRRTVGKLGEEEDKKGEPAIERRRECTDLGLDLGEREEQVVCHALNLGLGNDRRGASRSWDVSLAIFVTSESGSKSVASFTNRFFHLSIPPGFRRAFDASEKNGRFGLIQCQRDKVHL